MMKTLRKEWGKHMAIKLIFMDIDGTLTNSGKGISAKTKEVLKMYQKEGVRLVLTSGRTTMGQLRFARELEMEKYGGLLISFNGAQVYDLEHHRVLYNQAMSEEEAIAVLEHMKNFVGTRPVIDKGEYMYVKDVYDTWIQLDGKPFNVMQYESRSNGYKLCEVDDLVDLIDGPVNKILTYGDPEYLQAHYQDMMAPFKDRLNCMFTGPFYFEYTAKGIDKAKAIDTVFCQQLGYKKGEMIAFGDGHNDKTMLEYVGIGVAMGNAVQALKDIADEVTLSNDEDGIAYTLLKHKEF